MYKRQIVWLGVAVLTGLLGCDRPGPIELVHDDAREPVRVNFLLEGNGNDTLVVTNAEIERKYDITGMLPAEEEAYPATMLVNGIKFDLGGDHTEYSYSRVVLRDKSAPDTVSGNFGQILTFPHINVGSISLNGTALEREEVVLQIRSRTTLFVPNGVLYKLLTDAPSQSKPFVFAPYTEYLLVADGKAKIPPFIEKIYSPDEVTLVHPNPYSLVFSDEDLTLRWEGFSGQYVNVIISFFDETQQQVGRPIVELKPAPRTNAMLIPAKLLNLIPKTSGGRYVI
ncbi:MAG: hypothetical protein ACRDGA_07570, partial [Bacteroidota bacterium]